MLAAKVAEIGTADDPTSLMGMLADKTAEVVALMTTLGDETNPDADSVRGMLAASDRRDRYCRRPGQPHGHAGCCQCPDRHRGRPGQPYGHAGCREAKGDRPGDSRIAALEGGTDPVLLTPIQMAAKDASDAAATAETAAGAAADAAEKAAGTFADETMNQAKQATIQTGDANSAIGAMHTRPGPRPTRQWPSRQGA